ncbi:ferrichrome ABC transporter substrate-binding protein [uncultured Bacteroides sp.]|uniref:ferrichrome ABC transporter substrate-binding protein n=1 Tax=uncultured Bacteroides sp. TaxID=162156 RepID=UPI0025DC364C|nr:ferrichrome ABC transporter substrate-binding protein [uncultured Bacteroides sp.]
MEDFLKFLFIAGVILVGVFKEMNKNSQAKKTTGKRPVSPTPTPGEIAPDAVPVPEPWARPQSPHELLRPIPVEPPAPKRNARKAPKQQQHPPKKKKREEVSVAASIANSAAQDELNRRQNPHNGAPHDTAATGNGDFTIHSAEEARRALIWGEILQRKY